MAAGSVTLVASVDEYLEVHERLDLPGNRLTEHFPVDIGFTWVLLEGPIALVIALLLLRLVLSLPARARNGLILGAVLFLLGALGVESMNGMVLARNEHVVNNPFIYGTMLEELLEMSGVAVALASLLSLVQREPSQGLMRLDPTLSQDVSRIVRRGAPGGSARRPSSPADPLAAPPRDRA